MRSPFASLRYLVLPFGATSGARLELGIPPGTIGIYNSAGQLTGLLSPDGIPGGSSSSPGFFVFDPSSIDDYVALEAIAGFPGITFADSVADVIGRWSEGRTGAAGTTRRFFYEITTPRFLARNALELRLTSESEDGTIDPVANVTSSGAAPADLQLDGRTLPRGLLPNGLFRAVAPDAARAAGVLTDMTRTVELIAGRTYRVRAHSQANVGTAAAVYGIDLDYAGTIIGRFDRKSAADTPAGSLTVHIDGAVEFTAAANDAAAVLTVANSAGSGGTLTLTAGATNPRTLSVEDIGAP